MPPPRCSSPSGSGDAAEPVAVACDYSLQHRVDIGSRPARGCAARACCSRRTCTATGRTECARRAQQPRRRVASAASRCSSHCGFGRRRSPQMRHRGVARVPGARRAVLAQQCRRRCASPEHLPLQLRRSGARSPPACVCRMPWPRPQIQPRARVGGSATTGANTRAQPRVRVHRPAGAATRDRRCPGCTSDRRSVAQHRGDVVAPVDAEALERQALELHPSRSGPVPRE